MPTKVTERPLFAPGNLVQTRKAIYSTAPNLRLAEGTIGTILRGPQRGYENHCQVHFVSLGEPWWVHYNEIKPYWD